MKLSIFSVFDVAAQAFGRPFFMPSAGMAARSFEQEVNRVDENNMMYFHPDHFSLYCLGEFDDSDGSVVPITPQVVEQAKRVHRGTPSPGGTQ